VREKPAQRAFSNSPSARGACYGRPMARLGYFTLYRYEGGRSACASAQT
jgi:hypothetical protein